MTPCAAKMSERRKTWAELREEVRSVRRWLWGLSYRLPHSFAIREKTNGNYRVYFMSSPPNSKDNSLYAMDIPKLAPPLPSNQAPSLTFPWMQILTPEFQGSGGSPSKEEELQMERKRMTPSGISAYNFHSPTGTFLFNASTMLYTCTDADNKELPLGTTELSQSFAQHGLPRLNSEMCPHNSLLVAYVTNGDIFVLHRECGRLQQQVETQLTFTGEASSLLGPRAKTAGYPSYIIQEEFNRFQGFWWKPTSEDGVYQLLYEEVDESEVGLVSLLTPPGSEREEYRFPTPGSPNAKSTLRIVQFRVNDNGIEDVQIRDFSYPLENYFPYAEYIVRAGWTPDGHFVWVQLLDREQEYLQLILIKSPSSLDDGRTPPPYVIYNEMSSSWINVHDILEFFPYEEHDDTIEFLWASEETGFRHLYRIKSVLCHPVCNPESPTTENPPIRLTSIVTRKIQLTSGKWEVINSSITVDFERRLVYFTGLMNSPLERHLYVVSLDGTKDGGPPERLTSLGSSNNAVISLNHGLVIVTYSNITTPPRCLVTRLIYNSENPSNYSDVRLQAIAYLHTTSAPSPDPEIPPPLILTHELTSGETLYAMVYRPVNFDPTKKYPTVLNIYGGPEIQLVYNSYKVSGSGQLWLHLLASQGYCVVSVDSRGSNHRGVEFESHIRRRMGTVEVQDQVDVLTALAERLGFIDMDRIGIYGWSYGGYLTLMGLVQFPKLFKVAVAGAPVTSWDLYDTGYTERYMGLPSSNASAYQRSSVISYAHLFPDDENRLLIIHGLVDENVHFTHTAQLINALIKAGKPHNLQVYPHERHSLRRLEASEHFETTLLSFLHRNL